MALAGTQFTLGFDCLVVRGWGRRDISKTPNLRGRLIVGGEAASFKKLPYAGISRVLDRFFKRQIEECRELGRHAVDKEDRAFWQQAAARWEEQLRIVQHRQSASPLRVPINHYEEGFGVTVSCGSRTSLALGNFTVGNNELRFN